jgi:hypothetical protein
MRSDDRSPRCFASRRVAAKIPLRAGGTGEIGSRKVAIHIADGRFGPRGLFTAKQTLILSVSGDALYKMFDLKLPMTSREARRQFAEKKFARDTDRARLSWIRSRRSSAAVASSPSETLRSTFPQEIARSGSGSA